MTLNFGKELRLKNIHPTGFNHMPVVLVHKVGFFVYKAFLAFTNCSNFDFGGFRLTASQTKRLNAVIQTCGFYDEAGEFSYLVGLPGKSGVGGGIVAIHPGINLLIPGRFLY